MRQATYLVAAAKLGYTRAVIARNGSMELYLLVRPDADLGDTFKAWDTDNQEWIRVNGWLFTIRDAKPFRVGDKLRWTDPDDGICSRTLTVAHIEYRDDMVRITDTDGNELEAPYNELTKLHTKN